MQVFTLVEIEGRAPVDVAVELGIKQSSVTDVCSKVRTWLRSHGGRWDRITVAQQRLEVARELYAARLDHQWNELMEEWHRSKKPQTGEKGVYGPDNKVKQTEVTRRSKTGDVRYLIQAAHVLEKMHDLRNANSINFTQEEYDVRNATLIERRTELTALLKLYGPGARPDESGELVVEEEATSLPAGEIRAA
jgi:hypothetical protein